jgi:hypothetical protein
VRDYPEYLDAPDNEDSEATCEYCDEPCYDDGRYPELCYGCNEEAAEEAYWDAVASQLEDERMFPEDYGDRYDYGK